MAVATGLPVDLCIWKLICPPPIRDRNAWRVCSGLSRNI